MENWWMSVAGIAAAAVVAGGAARSALANVSVLNQIPVVVYVILSAIGLSAVAQYVMAVELAPSFGQLVVMAVTGALVAIGAVGAVTNATKPLAQTVADAKRFSVLFLAVLIGLSATACASRNGVPVSPEGTLALRANQFVQALRQTVTPAGNSPIEQLVASKRITAQDGITVATYVKTAMQGAEDLAAVLAVVDNAKTDSERQTGLARAAVLVQSIATGLERAKISVVSEDGRMAVALALRTASSLLLTVGSLFPPPAPAAPGGAAFAFGGADKAQQFQAAFGF